MSTATLALKLVIDWDSPLLFTDGYKPSHKKLYPRGMQKMESYFESRAGAKWNTTVLFGLQYFLLRYFVGQVVTEERIQQAKSFFAGYFGRDDVFDEAAWRYILENHNGYLPLEIKALPEGTVASVGNALIYIRCTDEKCAWLVNYVETALVQVWYPSTIATQSREIKKKLISYHKMTGMPDGAIDWSVHDFGFRGSTSHESAALGGASHLLSFYGSDTLAGDILLRNYYGATGLVSGSIPASEHSTVTTWGESHECDFLENLLDQFPTGIVANVIDSYDPERYIKVYAAKFRDRILARDGKLVFRPDSGDPLKMILKTLEWLEEVFGSTKNAKGFKVLPPQVGVIYGDGMNIDSMGAIYWTLKQEGWAAQNAFGSGGGLLQNVNRDTQRFAFKACWAQINDQPRNVCKRPSTDSTKNSKSGRLHVFLNKAHKRYEIDSPIQVTLNTEQAQELGYDLNDDLLQVVYRNGEMIRTWTLEEVRERAKVD